MMGEEWPAGASIFQATFLSGAISVGSGRPSVACAVPFRPRNCGHEASAPRPGEARQNNAPAHAATTTTLLIFFILPRSPSIALEIDRERALILTRRFASLED